MSSKKTVVLGASNNPNRYSFLAVNKLVNHGHPVVAVGIKKGNIQEIEIQNDNPVVENVDTVTLYLNPANQVQYYDYMLSLHPKRIIFNPGTENAEFEDLARSKGIETLEACTLVMLSTGMY